MTAQPQGRIPFDNLTCMEVCGLSKVNRCMARCAMLFVYLSVLACLSAGCEKASYEAAVYTGEENLYPAESDQMTESETAAGTDSSVPQVAVYICGAVKNPGVYMLESGARVIDALEAAGGFLPEADERGVNLARVLSDGEQVTIRTLVEAEEGGVSAEEKNPDDGRININTADAEELQKLPGIGKTKAGDIIAWRNEHGAFRTAEDIMKVSGIKESLFGRIKESITVG